MENSVLIFSPIGKDARLIVQVLANAGIESEAISHGRELVFHLNRGAAALVIAQEALTIELMRPLVQFLNEQQTWSDLPVLLLSTRSPDSVELRRLAAQLGNVTLLERPLQSVTLASAVNSAIRGRRRQYEMREIDRHKDEFLAMLAHELRNPLAPVSAAAELLKMPNFDSAKVPATGAIILRQVKHMTGLIDDLLDVSRVSRGLVQLEMVEIDLCDIVPDAVEQLRPLIASRRHQLIVEFDDCPLLVMGDKKRLVQIVANLLNNAAKYTGEGGQIVLRVEASGADICLSVSDSGIGMSQAVMDTVFDMFAQGKRTPDRSQGGLGIGLALVKTIVTLHGGTVEARSTGAGRGSRFLVKLPRVFSATPAQSNPPQQAPAKEVDDMRILIVDDNVDAAQTMGMLLEAVGYKVEIEHSGRAGLEHARATMPRVCLLDIGLPDIDGMQIAASLRSSDATRDMILVAITGYGQEGDARRALEAGFDHHMVKPANTEKLLALLANLAKSDGAGV